MWRGRSLYNCARHQRKTWWERGLGTGATYYQQPAELPELKRAHPEFADLHAHVLQDVMLRLDRTFEAFCRRVKVGEEPGDPRFQGKGRYPSFTFPEYGTGAVLAGGLLSLSTIGRLRIRLHRPLAGTPKTVTILRAADGGSAGIACAEVPTVPLPLTGQETGLDVGLKVFLLAADGQAVENPRHYRPAQRALRKAQRRGARRKKASHRRRQAVQLVARAHQPVRRQRADCQHQTALALVQHYDPLSVEAIPPATLSRRPTPQQDENGDYEHNGASRKAGLNKSIHDAGWRHFLTIRACTAACAGKRVEAVCPAYTTQECSGCGERVAKSLSVRTHVCPSCGLVLDRDEHAALNILRAGQARQALTWPGAASVA